jgi:hypothetical protein
VASIRSLGLCAALALLALPTPAAAQTAAPVLYRLDARSDYTWGCFDPCACPIAFTDDLFGTYELEFLFAGTDGFDHYAVRDVNWILAFGGEEHRVTGSGEYLRGGPLAPLERVLLDLSFDGAAPVQFDSGHRPAGVFPRIDLPVSRNGMYCYDEVYGVRSSPVPASAVFPYQMRRSGYVEGCFPPCACPIALWRAGGTFDLVPLGTNASGSREHYAIVDADWHTALLPAPPAHAYTGFGTYTLDHATGTHRLVADLSELGVARRFDSGEVPGGAGFPRIDVDVSVNGLVCYDYLFLVHARP